MINLDETPKNNELSPGKLLSQGRLQVGLTQEQVAKELYLTVAKVNALESDDFDRVGPDTFVRGYIRAYSNILKLDASKVSAAYEQSIKEKLQISSSAAAPVSVSSNKRTWKFVAVIGGTFIGLWLISIWFFNTPANQNYVLPTVETPSLVISVDNFVAASEEQQSSSMSESLASSASVEAQALPTVSVATASTAAAVGAVTALVSVNASSSIKSASSQVVAKSSVAVANVKVASAIRTNELDEITFIFRAECWLEISDSRGDVLATELQAAGSELNLVGKAPFDVKLGNAPAVAIQLNGKKIPVTPIPGSKVLTLKVDGNR